MEKYNYLESVKEDVKNYILENEIEVTEENRQEVESQLNDDLLTEDSVTGNASGSYTFNRAKAEEYLCGNLDLLADAFEEFGGFEALRQGGGGFRCYYTLLPFGASYKQCFG